MNRLQVLLNVIEIDEWDTDKWAEHRQRETMCARVCVYVCESWLAFFIAVSLILALISLNIHKVIH